MPQQQGGQCPFCQLIANPDQLLTVGETDNFYAWLEINPRAKGHTMVVPKEHKESVLDFSPEEYQEAMKLTRMVIEKAEEGLGADGASVTINIEEAGGQMVPHAYIQVFPRFQDEENAGTPTGAIFPQREELQQQLQDIQDSMSSVTVDFESESHEAHPESQKHKRKGSGGFSSRLVDREKAKSKTSSTEKKETTQEESKTEELLEPGEDEKTEEAESEEKEDEEGRKEEELEGEGHWDGKSFEWR